MYSDNENHVLATRWWPPTLLVTFMVAALLAGCGSTPDDLPASDQMEGVRVGSFDFAESELIAELYGQVLESRGLTVVRLGVVGPREIVAPALERGLIDVVPEYTGTAAQHYSGEVAALTASTIDDVLKQRGLMMLESAPAENQNVFVVTAASASLHDLGQISDLSSWQDFGRLGGPVECSTRPFCLLGLSDVYGVDVAEFVPQRSLAVTAEALVRDEIDVGVMFSTAAELLSESLFVLEDDRNLQPDEHIAPLVRIEALERWGPELSDALNAVSNDLTTGEVRRFNQAVADGTPVADVVSEWLEKRDLG